MDDGVGIATTLYTPTGPTPTGGWPTLMLFAALGETRQPMNMLAETYLASDGYAVLTFDARGTGESGGLVSLDGPREIQDVRTLFDWLAGHHGIARTRIGALGFSYGGGAVWRATAEGVPFAAIVPVSTWTDFYGALFPQNLAKGGAFASLLAPVPAARLSDLLLSSTPDIYASTNLPAIRSLAADRSSVAALARLKTPVFMVQGRRDFAFGMEQATDAYARLRGPKRLYIGDLGNAPATNPEAERGVYLTEARLWFDRYLRGVPNGIEYAEPIEIAPDPWTGKTAKFWSFPARRALSVPLLGSSTIGATEKVVRTARKRLARNIEEFGAPTVRLTASSPGGWPHLVAVLTARTPRGGQIVVSEGGIQTPVGPIARSLTIRLINDATFIPRGSRLQLTIAATSTAQSPANTLYIAGVPGDAQVTIGRAQVTIPTLRKPISH
jgi:predicted acyl esterase